MELKSWRDPTTLDKHVHLTITDYDMMTMDRTVLSSQQVFLDEFNRPDASIEERLMGLQIIARAIEEGHNKLKEKV